MTIPEGDKGTIRINNGGLLGSPNPFLPSGEITWAKVTADEMVFKATEVTYTDDSGWSTVGYTDRATKNAIRDAVAIKVGDPITGQPGWVHGERCTSCSVIGLPGVSMCIKCSGYGHVPVYLPTAAMNALRS
jgi:hypothetical protein